MNPGGRLEIISDSLLKARHYYEERNYGRAFAHYLVVFQLLRPEARLEYEKEFSTVLQLWGTILHNREKYEDIFRCYHLATSYFPESVEIINNLGVHVLKLKCYNQAKVYFERCLNLNPHFLPAEQNLQTTKYALVERWHFPMLNDLVRNKSYAQAIFMEISHGFTNILDVGTGTGILSLFASKSKQCKNITACDYSDTMFEIAAQVLEANNVRNIKLIKKRSNELVIPNDLHTKATLLVTEILDSGIFGENILDTLIHSWENLLNPSPYGKVIPSGVSVFISGIFSNELSREVRLLRKENDILNFNNIYLSHIPVPYDTENLKTANVIYMTETQVGLFVDFNNIEQLKKINNSDSNSTVNLKCLSTGTIDAFAIWFTLHLNDSISLTNNPNSIHQSCWDQAVIYLKHPLEVKQNNELSVKLSCTDGVLKISCGQISKNECSGHKNNCFSVPRNVISFLNDLELIKNLEEISVTLWEHYRNSKNFKILDISPFPILGLMLSKFGAILTCRVENTDIEKLIYRVCDINNIPRDKITVVNANNFNEFMNADIEFDVIFQNLVSPCGLLFESEIYQVQIMKYSITEQGIYLPNKVEIWAQIVDCEWLDQATKVDDKNVCGFKIAEFINKYKSTEQRYINFNAIQYTCISEPINLACVEYDVLNVHQRKINVPIIKQGRANAVFYWFDIELLEGKNVDTRRPDSFASNSAFIFDKSVSLDTGNCINLVIKQHRGIIKIYLSELD